VGKCIRNLRISYTTQRGLKPSIFRKPVLRFTDTSAILNKVSKNKETHLYKRPQEITLKGHDDINIVIDYEQADLSMCRLHTFTYPLSGTGPDKLLI
jgi:predicted metalloprotease